MMMAAATQHAQTRFALVEDHPVMREALRSVLEGQTHWKVVSLFTMPSEAIRGLRSTPVDAMILDLVFDGESGLALISYIRTHHPNIRMLVYSVRGEPQYAERCLRAGAMGYVTKEEPMPVLVHAVQCVLRGELYVTSSIASWLIRASLNKPSLSETDLIGQLSDRELEVFELIGQGLSTKAISSVICRSVKTIETYRLRIKRKLGVENATQLAQWAVRHVEANGHPLVEAAPQRENDDDNTCASGG